MGKVYRKFIHTPTGAEIFLDVMDAVEKIYPEEFDKIASSSLRDISLVEKDQPHENTQTKSPLTLRNRTVTRRNTLSAQKERKERQQQRLAGSTVSKNLFESPKKTKTHASKTSSHHHQTIKRTQSGKGVLAWKRY